MNRLRWHLGYSLGEERYQTALDPNLFRMGKNQESTIRIAGNGELANVC